MDCNKMWIIRTLLLLLAFSAHTYAFYIRTDDVELQQEPSDLALETTNEYNNYAPQPRSLGLMETYEKLRNYLTSPWKKENDSSIITPENMQNVSQYENMQQNELSFDPYHLTKQNISRSDPVDFHASEFLPILTEKYLKINLTAGQKKSEENFEDVKDDWRMDDSRVQLENGTINVILSNASESETTKKEDEEEPMDLLRSLNPLDYAEDLIEGQEIKNLTENAENIVDTDKDNIIEITNEKSTNDIAGDINQNTERAVDLVEDMIEDLEDQFSASQVQVISTTMIPSDDTAPYINLDFVHSNINTEENYVNADQVENFKRETKEKTKISQILSGDDDDLVVIEGKPVNSRTNTNEITEVPTLFNENDDSLIIQGRRLNSDEITTQLPEEETTSAQLNEVDSILNRNKEINILNYITDPSSDILTTIFPIVTNPVLEDHPNSDLAKNIFTSTMSTFEENTSGLSQISETTPQIDQVESITENEFQLRVTFPGVNDDLILLVPRPSNATENKNNIAEAPEPCNVNDDSLIIVGRSLNCIEGETASIKSNKVNALPEIETEGNILNEINPSSDIFSMTNEHLEIPSTTVLSITSDHVLEDHTSSEEIIFTTTISTNEETNSEMAKYDEILHDQSSQNITEVNATADTTTEIDQNENIRSVENDNVIVNVKDLENEKNTENDSVITLSHNPETISQPELTTLEVDNDTEGSSKYFTNLLGTFTDLDTTTKDVIQIEELNETSTITAPVYNDEDLASPILTDPFNIFEISEELVKPRSMPDESADKLENLDVNIQDSFENENIEETTLYTVDADTTTHIDNQYINTHQQNDEFTTEFITEQQTVERELFSINPSTEISKDDLTTEKYFDNIEKLEDVSNKDQVIYTTTVPDSTTIGIDNHNTYVPTILFNEQNQFKSDADSANGRSFDFSVNLIETPKIIPTTTQHEEEQQFDLMTEEPKTIETLIAANSDQFTQNIVTAQPFSYIETGEPSVLKVEDNVYSPATDINFKSHEEDTMRISDQSSDLLKMQENSFTTELPKLEFVGNKYQNQEFSTASNEVSKELEHREDVSKSTNFSKPVFEEEDATERKTDPENKTTTVKQLSPITITLADNLNALQQLELTTEDSKPLEITTRDSFEHATQIFTEHQTFNTPSENVNELDETNQTVKTDLEGTGIDSGSTEDSDSALVEFNNLADGQTTKFNIKNEDSKSDDGSKHGEKSTHGEDDQINSASNEDSSIDISLRSDDLASKSIYKKTNSGDSESDESNEHDEKSTDGEDQQNDSVSNEDSSIDISPRSHDLASKSIDRKNNSGNSESNESNEHGKKSADGEDQQNDSVSNEDSSIDISAQSRDLASKSTGRKNKSKNSESDESNEYEEKPYEGDSNRSKLSEETSSSIETSDQSPDNKSDYSASESIESEEKPSNEESVQSASIEDYSSSVEANNIDDSESSDSNQSDDNSSKSKTFNVEKRTDSASNEKGSSTVEIDDNGTTTKSVTNKFDNEDSEMDDSNQAGERTSEEFHHIEKKFQSVSSEEDISSIENSDQSKEDHEDHSLKSKKSYDSKEDSSEESVEEIIPFPIQRAHQGRSFSFDENDNRHDYGQQITPDKKSPPFTKVVFSDPIEGENDNPSVVMDKEVDNDSNTQRGMEDESSPDSDDVSTAVVETLIEAAELTTEFTRHISSFRSSTEASDAIPDTTYETPTTSFPPVMDKFDREQFNSQIKEISTSLHISQMTMILIGLAIFATVATIAAVIIFKYRNRRETFDIQLEERHEKKDSNTTQSTTNGVE